MKEYLITGLCNAIGDEDGLFLITTLSYGEVYTVDKDIEYVVEKLTKVIKRVREISSVSQEVNHG